MPHAGVVLNVFAVRLFWRATIGMIHALRTRPGRCALVGHLGRAGSSVRGGSLRFVGQIHHRSLKPGTLLASFTAPQPRTVQNPALPS